LRAKVALLERKRIIASAALRGQLEEIMKKNLNSVLEASLLSAGLLFVACESDDGDDGTADSSATSADAGCPGTSDAGCPGTSDAGCPGTTSETGDGDAGDGDAGDGDAGDGDGDGETGGDGDGDGAAD
jgi:hypothetical protein